ncbi:hypothetical protein [Falsiroseomonas sp.]|uniref:hypothetical protein n=1 Tax=Falsiroseomonas sp. TaxID=2870721 RepID=UPI0035643368
MPVGRKGAHLGNACGTAPRAGRGDNHGRRGGAIAWSLAAALLGTGLAAGGAMPLRPAAAQENPLVQRGIPAEATAENAVVARDRALASGQRIAYERMAAALGLPRNLSDARIEAQVASLVIESERITPRGYSARITVNFNPPGGGVALAPPPAIPGAPSGGPAVATVEAVAGFRSLPEYVEITRRLSASPAVARYEVVSVSGQAALLRLSLRSQPQAAAAELGRSGLSLARGQDPRPGGEGWHLGLAGGR